VFSDRLPGAPVYPPSDPAKIEIFRQIVPQRPYVSLGRIRVEPDSTIPREEVDRLLRAEAAKMGADAVLVETEGTRVVGVNYQQGGGFANLDAPQEVTAPLIIGAAIRYR
jgi:flavin-dependent dehydrogenase